MADITIRDFSGGWHPCDNPLNGAKNSFLQMDNLELDTTGALTLQGGTAVRNSYSSPAHTLCSKLVNGVLIDYVATADGAIYRNATSIGTGGDSTNAAFATAFKYTLATSGNKRIKDDGTTPIALGINPPLTAPTVVPADGSLAPRTFIAGSNISAFYGVYVTPKGTITDSTYMQFTTDSSNYAIAQIYPAVLKDTTLLRNPNAIPGTTPGFSTAGDGFYLNGYTTNPAGVSLTFDVLLVASNSSGDLVTDFYRYEVSDLASLTFDPYTGQFTLSVTRGDFVRFGSGSQDWNTAYGYRITIGAISGTVVNVWGRGFGTPFSFYGGTSSQSGIYQYAQMNVNNTGSYIAKSVLSPLTQPITIDSNQSLITPINPVSVDSQCNEAWIFRRGGLLDQWYRVKIFDSTTSFDPDYDETGDLDALTLDITVNLNLVSIAATTITDKIYDIIGPVNGRWYYFTEQFMYPSDLNDPDLVDVSLGIRLCNSKSELFMWARLVGTSTILVGTSLDVYSLSGTFATLPDNSVDIYYLPTGCKYPPITCDAEVYGGTIFYMANDGWRTLSGSGQAAFTGNTNQSLVSPVLDRLYRGETCSGYQPPSLTNFVPRSARFPIVVAKNKIWCCITGLATPRIEVYDTLRQYWRPISFGLGDVTAATRTQDGQIAVFFKDNKLRTIDVQSSKLIDGSGVQAIRLNSMVYDNGTPHIRKDTATLKVRIRGLYGVTFTVTGDVGTTSVSTIGSEPIAEQYFDLSETGVALVKTYQFSMSGSVIDFSQDELTLIYDPRPEQRTFIRVQSNNYDTTGRKRISSIPFQLDSIGGTVTFTPILDGVPLSPSYFTCNRKESFDLDFQPAALGVDYEYTIQSSNLFEFFGFQQPRIVEVYPQPCKSFYIPSTNLGSANKKRVRVWPFVLSSPSGAGEVTFTPVVDGIPLLTSTSSFNVISDKLTYRHYFKTDVFGVDYSGYFTSNSEFEVGDLLQPEVVQLLPIAKRFDQVGPQELFRFGKLQQLELRVLPINGTSIPYTIYFQDGTSQTGAFTVVSGVDASYFIKQVKGASGNILRIELGPTNFDFHRFYMRGLIVESGKDTEGQWIEL